MAYQVEEEVVLPGERYQEFISSLPQLETGWLSHRIRYFQGFWYPEFPLPGQLAFQDQFKPRDTDIFLCSPPKCGTTWLKALAFAMVNRKLHKPSAQDHPLLHMNPHDCVPFVDEVYLLGQASKLENLGPPRILSIHAPYQLLHEHLISSPCKFVYICRDPKDMVVSHWHYMRAMLPDIIEPLPFSKAFDMYCEGTSSYGPVWDHNLGYWTESLRRPSKILFFKYEEVMQDTGKYLRKLAEFLECPFSKEEEEEGVVEEIVRLCSFDNLKDVEVNKKGEVAIKNVVVKNSSYFRKGKVGDWKNHLTTEMAQRLNGIFAEKLSGSGLSF